MFPKKKSKPQSLKYTNLCPKEPLPTLSVEKTLKTRPKRKNLRSEGKNNLGILKRQWNAEWKQEHKDIHWCESCGQPDGFGNAKLTQMHALKQRFITTETDCKRAAWVCWGEHRRYDFATGENVHAKMAQFVDNLIIKREQADEYADWYKWQME